MSEIRYNAAKRCNFSRSGVQCRFSPGHPGMHEFVDDTADLRAALATAQRENSERIEHEGKMLALVERLATERDALRAALTKASNFAESSIEMMREDLGEDEDELAEYTEWLADWRALAKETP